MTWLFSYKYLFALYLFTFQGIAIIKYFVKHIIYKQRKKICIYKHLKQLPQFLGLNQ